MLEALEIRCDAGRQRWETAPRCQPLTAPQAKLSDLTARLEELNQPRLRLRFADAAIDLGRVVAGGLPEEAGPMVHRAHLFVAGAVVDAADAGEGDGGGAHGARFERHVKIARADAFAAERFACGADRDHLGMGRRVFPLQSPVPALADDRTRRIDDTQPTGTSPASAASAASASARRMGSGSLAFMVAHEPDHRSGVKRAHAHHRRQVQRADACCAFGPRRRGRHRTGCARRYSTSCSHGLDGFDIEGARVLDLFAGTGAMGLEALSRGGRIAMFVDESAEARGLIRNGKKSSVSTNEYGFYSITLPKETYQIVISYLGYDAVYETIELSENTKKDFKLIETTEILEEVIIFEKVKSNIRKPEMSVNKLTISNYQKNARSSW